MLKTKKPKGKEKRQPSQDYLETLGYERCGVCGSVLFPVMGCSHNGRITTIHQCVRCNKVYEEVENVY